MTLDKTETLCFEMESIKTGTKVGTSYHPACVIATNTGRRGKFRNGEASKNEKDSSQPINAWQSDAGVARRLLFISLAVGIAAFLAATTALVLALVMMTSQINNTTVPKDQVAVQGK